MQTYGIEYLRNKLEVKRTRVNLRYSYYDMKQIFSAVSPVIPPNFEHLMSVLGWCKTAVDTLADRLVFDRFTDDDYYLNELFDMNSRDIFTAAAVRDALIAGCSFVYISSDESGYPRLQVIDGGEATGIIDPITNLLTEGYAVLERDERTLQPVCEAYFTAEKTAIFRSKKPVQEIIDPTGHPLLVPMVFKPSAKRPFRQSRITRANMSLIEDIIERALTAYFGDQTRFNA